MSEIKEKISPKTKSRNSIMNFLDGSILTREVVVDQLPFIFFLTLLAVIYISNRYHAEMIVRDTVKIQREIKDLRSEAISVASDLMYISKQSEVANLVETRGLGLFESIDPPYKILVRNN